MSKLSAVELSEIGGQIRQLALQAGEILLEGHGRVQTIDSKQGTEFVTEMDRRVEDYLLGELDRRFPDDAIEAEETGNKEGVSGRTWYVDPLDGTTNYAHGYPFFSVSIALADRDELLSGTVLAPYLNELYQAYLGGGSTMERPGVDQVKKLPQRIPVDLESALLATGFPYVRDDVVDLNAGLVRDFLKACCHGVRRGGSAALDLAHVASGKLDGYWEMKLRTWDTAAGILIARQAGATVTDFGGCPERIHTQNILAAAPGLHSRMVATFAESHPGRWPGPGGFDSQSEQGAGS